MPVTGRCTPWYISICVPLRELRGIAFIELFGLCVSPRELREGLRTYVDFSVHREHRERGSQFSFGSSVFIAAIERQLPFSSPLAPPCSECEGARQPTIIKVAENFCGLALRTLEGLRQLSQPRPIIPLFMPVYRSRNSSSAARAYTSKSW